MMACLSTGHITSTAERSPLLIVHVFVYATCIHTPLHRTMLLSDTNSLLLRARLAQLDWPCYRSLRISSVMQCPDRALKNWCLVTPSVTLSNCVKFDITLANHRSTCPIITHSSTCHSCSNFLTATWRASVLFKSCLQSKGHIF